MTDEKEKERNHLKLLSLNKLPQDVLSEIFVFFLNLTTFHSAMNVCLDWRLICTKLKLKLNFYIGWQDLTCLFGLLTLKNLLTHFPNVKYSWKVQSFNYLSEMQEFKTQLESSNLKLCPRKLECNVKEFKRVGLLPNFYGESINICTINSLILDCNCLDLKEFVFFLQTRRCVVEKGEQEEKKDRLVDPKVLSENFLFLKTIVLKNAFGSQAEVNLSSISSFLENMKFSFPNLKFLKIENGWVPPKEMTQKLITQNQAHLSGLTSLYWDLPLTIKVLSQLPNLNIFESSRLFCFCCLHHIKKRKYKEEDSKKRELKLLSLHSIVNFKGRICRYCIYKHKRISENLEKNFPNLVTLSLRIFNKDSLETQTNDWNTGTNNTRNPKRFDPTKIHIPMGVTTLTLESFPFRFITPFPFSKQTITRNAFLQISLHEEYSKEEESTKHFQREKRKKVCQSLKYSIPKIHSLTMNSCLPFSLLNHLNATYLTVNRPLSSKQFQKLEKSLLWKTVKHVRFYYFESYKERPDVR